MRIVFFGAAPCSVPYLEAIRRVGGEIVAVVTTPDRPAGRGQELCASPVKQAALGLQVCLLQPESCSDPQLIAELQDLAPDILLVVAYGEILCAAMLAVPRVAALNVHYSLLPKLRGAAPVQHALLQGLTETGVTLQHLSLQLDAGDIIAQARVAIQPEDDAASLTQRLTESGCQLVEEYLPQVMAGTAPRIKQEESQATYAPRLKKEDGYINWHESAAAIVNRIRAVTPWPGAQTAIGGRRLIIKKARVRRDRAGNPGELVEISYEEGCGPVVAAGEDAVELLQVQPAGRRVMSGGEFMRGARLKVGDLFTSLTPEARE